LDLVAAWNRFHFTVATSLAQYRALMGVVDYDDNNVYLLNERPNDKGEPEEAATCPGLWARIEPETPRGFEMKHLKTPFNGA